MITLHDYLDTNWAKEAESNVLGACLLHPDAVLDCDVLRPADFYLPKNQRIFLAILTSHQATGLTDPIAVGEVLAGDGEGADPAVDAQALMQLMEGVITAAGVAMHAKIVKEHSDRRRLIDVFVNAAGSLTDHKVPVAEVIARAASRMEGRAPAVKPWECFSLDDYLATRTSPWAIHGLFRVMQVVLLGSFPGVGKSTALTGMIYATLTGSPWCGRTVRQGSVVALVGEGMKGFSLRLEAERKRSGLPIPSDRYLGLYKFKVAMSSPEGQGHMRALVAEAVAQHGHNPALVVIDTLSSHWSADEDSQESIAPFMRAVSQIAEEFECSVVIVHHTTKSKGMFVMPELQDFRGSGAIIGAADCVIGACATKDRAGVILSTVKTKDDEPIDNMNLVREVVPLGVDENGDAITGAVLVEAKEAQAPKFDETKQQVNEQREAQREMLDQCMAAMRELGGRTTSKDAVYALMTGKTSRKRGAFSQLVDRGEIRHEGPERGRTYYLTTHPDCPADTHHTKEPKERRGGADPSASYPPHEVRGGAGADGADGAANRRATA